MFSKENPRWVGCMEFVMGIKNLIFHLNGINPGIYTEIDMDSDVFMLNGGSMLFKFTRKNSTTYQLESSHQVDYQHPYPVISWSGVLQTRQEALQAQDSLTAFALGLNQID